MNKTELINKIYSKIAKILEEDLNDSDMGKKYSYDEDEDEYYTVDDLESEIQLQLENYIFG